VTVLAELPTRERASVIHLSLGRTFRPLKGLERLVQLFIKLLLQTPGSDKFNPERGGGLLRLAGPEMLGSPALTTAVSMSVSRTKEQIYSLQRRVPRTPPDERLLDASPQAVGYDRDTTSLLVEVRILALSGQQAVTNLTF